VHVLATAGHVDHGKSTLVTALTGADPDRLAEEKRRGLTIELGYCWTTLPGVGDVAFVDVPGHQRFVPTMLSGVGPVPAVLFVVAADDGWMPQAAEHLAALDALGVRHGVVAVTRSDLADPQPAADRARREMSSTSLRGSPVVAVSAPTGAGMGRLRHALVELVAGLPVPDPTAPVRMWVDRAFVARGMGRVVTGTLATGTIRVGDRLACGESVVRVRRVECLERAVDEVSAVARVALAVGGDVPEALDRGGVLTSPDAFVECSLVDVRLTSDDQEPPLRPLLHVGAARTAVTCRPLGAGLARLRLDRPVPLRIADRGLLRDPGSRGLWGFVVLDPVAPDFTNRGDAERRRVALGRLSGGWDVGEEVRRRGLVRISVLRKIGIDCTDIAAHAIVAAGWAMDSGLVPGLARRLLDLVDDHDRAHPYEPGLPVTTATRALGLPTDPMLNHLMVAPLRVESGRVMRETTPAVPSGVVEVVRRIEGLLDGDPFAAPTADQLATLGADRTVIAAAARWNLLLRVSDGVVLLPTAVEQARELLARLPQPFTVSEAREALHTSRRVAVPLLEHLDRSGVTRRLDDGRRSLSSCPSAVAGPS
jgi:selenocysteine-specific elongation factor